MGGGRGSLTLGVGENCGPNILFCSPFPAWGADAGQTPFAGSAPISVCSRTGLLAAVKDAGSTPGLRDLLPMHTTTFQPLYQKGSPPLPQLRTGSDPPLWAFFTLGVLSLLGLKLCLPMSGCTILGIGTSRLTGSLESSTSWEEKLSRDQISALCASPE